MLDIKKIRENSAQVAEKLMSRGVDESTFENFVKQDELWRKHLQEVDVLKEQRNTLTPKGKPNDEQREQLKRLSLLITEKQKLLIEMEDDLKKMSLEFPNITSSEVPLGKNDEDNVVVNTVGDLPEFDFNPLTHDELGVKCDILDAETAVHVTGSRFINLKGKGAALERALINFMLDQHTQKNGYSEVMPPVIVNSKSLIGTGQLPKFSDDLFKLEDSEYYLSPTAEVQLTNIFRDTVLAESDLPTCVTAYTSCFRKEAGSYGKDMKGLIRLHQFNKVELVKIVHPDHSMKHWEALVMHAESILKLLKLPYRLVELCSGDLGFSSARTVDLEVWFPSNNAYREISSCSNFLDFQSRRAIIKYKCNKSGKLKFVHTLNGSGLAVGRTLAAIIENFQDKSGNIHVPDVLKKYVNFEKI